MALAQGVSTRVAYKFYATGQMDPSLLADPLVAPGPIGGVSLRRLASTVTLAKDTFQSSEVRTDYQIVDFRHGSRRVEGNISGEWSCGTYFPLFEAVHRDTKLAAVTGTETTLTSLVVSKTGSTFTFGGGDPVALGFKCGNIIRFTTVNPAVDATNFIITGFSGASNRTMKVWPPPSQDLVTPDVTFSVASIGKSTSVPSTNFIRRLLGIEVFHGDLNVARLYTEVRVGSYRIVMPTTGMCTVEFGFLGRSQYAVPTGPYFTAPTAPTNTGLISALDGVLLVNGTAVGLVTSADIIMNLNPEPAVVIGQDYPSEIFLGRENLTGTINAYLDTANSMLTHFFNETEVSLLLYMRSTDFVPNPSAVTLYLPRIKLSSAAVNVTGEAGQAVTYNFQALKYVGAAPGIPQTTIQINDTEAI